MKSFDEFIEIDASPVNVDRWIHRTNILQELRAAYPLLHGNMLDIGCGKMPYRSEILSQSKVAMYTGLDIEGAIVYDQSIRADCTWDGITMPFEDGAFDCAMATEVLEHVPDIDLFLKEVIRVLRPGGTFFFTTPFLWPYHEVPFDFQRWTAFGLRFRLEKAGFRTVNVTSVGSWHSALAQMLGLWVARAPIRSVARKPLRHIVYWLQKGLLSRHRNIGEHDASMFCLCSGTAQKGDH